MKTAMIESLDIFVVAEDVSDLEFWQPKPPFVSRSNKLLSLLLKTR